ncbi:MAG TPA: SurA N-terminal domain-containing protein [Polyangiaceae bacterium]|nr:SurA N-terminal domain-containing protein [Polyangiaceae bacterium]
MSQRALRSLVVGFALLFAAPAARASPVVDRLVAVVDETPMFLSELRARAKPHRLRIDAQKPDAARRAALEAQVYRELLDKMIEEELIGRAAKAAHINVTDAEIDAAVALMSKATNLSREAFFAEVARQGFTEPEYRAEVGRQLLEGKWLQSKAPPPPGAKPEEAAAHLEAERRRLVRGLREQAFVEVRL